MMLRRSTVRAPARFALAFAFAALALQVAAPAPPALAQTADEINQARATAKEAFAAYKANDFKKALVLFDQARKQYPSAQILRMTGYSYLALDEWEKAAELMDAAIASNLGPLDADDKKDTVESLAKAMPHLGLLSVTTDVAGAELIVDERAAVKLPLDKPLRLLAGKHKLTVRAPEHKDASHDVTVEGGGKLAEMKLSPAPIPKKVEVPVPTVTATVTAPPRLPPPAPKGWIPMQMQIGLIAGGAGAAIGAVAVTTGVGALHLTDQVNADIARHDASYGKNCEKVSSAYYRDCYFDTVVINHDADRANELATWSLATAIAGGVLLGGGIALVLFAPEGPLGPKPKPAASDASARRPKAPSGLSAACAPLPTGGVTCAGTF